MRNNNIIVILASIVGLSFIGVTAQASCLINEQPIEYPEIRDICGGEKTWPNNAACDTYAKNTLMPNISDYLVKKDTTCAVNGTTTHFIAVRAPQKDYCSLILKKVAVLCKSRGTSQTVDTSKPTTKPTTTTSNNNGSNNQSNNSSTSTGSTGGNSGNAAGAAVGAAAGTNPTTSQSNTTPTGDTTVAGARTYSTVDGGKTTTVTDGTGNYVIEGNKAYQLVDGKKVELTPDQTKVMLDNKLKEVDVKLTENKDLQSRLTSKDEKTREDAQKELKKELKTKEQQEVANKEAAEKAALASVETELTTLISKTQAAATKYNTQYTSTKNPDDLMSAEECNKSLAALTKINEPVQKLAGKGAKCQSTGSVAHFICPIVTNPAVQTASTVMTVASTALSSMSSAYDTCNVTQKINTIGQGLVVVGSLTCGASKAMCETSCGNSEKAATEIATYQADVLNCKDADASAAAQAFFKKTQDIQASSVAQSKECSEHKISQEQMATMAAGMISAAGQAQICKQKLAAMEGSNNTAQVYSMDEMCAQAQNVNSTLCKCRTDNTAPGCPGYVAGSGNEGNINKTLSSAGASGMAGLSYGSKITGTGGTTGLDAGLDGLSDEAKKALAAGGDQKQDGGMFGGAGAASAGGGGSTAAAGGGAGADKGKSVEEPKSIGSSFMNAVSSLFKGGSSGKAAPVKDEKFASDKYKEQIKRQIAAEQMRSEISSASGVDNWSKIRTRYKSNASSLIDSN